VKDLKILILYASYGNGHKQAAYALEQEFYRQGAQKVILSDVYIESYPKFANFTRTLYEKSYKPIGLPIYKAFYYGTDRYSRSGLAYLSQFIGLKRIREIIERERPDAIITTFPILSAPKLGSTEQYAIPTYTVITDYCLHSFWIHPNIHRYFVSSDKVGEELHKLGVAREKIVVSGIPIRASFESEPDVEKFYRTYPVDPAKKIVTVVAGAVGQLRNVEKLVPEILENRDIQVIVICGNNEKLYQKIVPLREEYPGRLTVFGYVENIHEILAASYCVITKPGGISITEAAAMKVPLIFFKPVPGQERENAEFFQASGAAFVTYHLSEIKEKINWLLRDGNKQREMKKAMERIYKPHASGTIVSEVIRSLENRLPYPKTAASKENRVGGGG